MLKFYASHCSEVFVRLRLCIIHSCVSTRWLFSLGWKGDKEEQHKSRTVHVCYRHFPLLPKTLEPLGSYDFEEKSSTAPQQSKFASPWADDFSCVFCIGSVMSINLACFAASAGAGVAFGVTRCCRFFNPFSKLSHFLKNLHRLIYEGIWLLQRGKTEGSKEGRDLDPCPRQL